MSRIKVTENIFNYPMLNAEQLQEQLRVQKERLARSTAYGAEPREYDILHDIFLNIKYIERELRRVNKN